MLFIQKMYEEMVPEFIDNEMKLISLQFLGAIVELTWYCSTAVADATLMNAVLYWSFRINNATK